MHKNRRKSIKNDFCSIKVRGKSEISQIIISVVFTNIFFDVLDKIFVIRFWWKLVTRLKKGCSLSWNSQNYHFPSFSGAGAGAQNGMECAKLPGETPYVFRIFQKKSDHENCPKIFRFLRYESEVAIDVLLNFLLYFVLEMSRHFKWRFQKMWQDIALVETI